MGLSHGFLERVIVDGLDLGLDLTFRWYAIIFHRVRGD